MSKFIPEIYKRLGTTVSVDLGTVARLGAIEHAIGELGSQIKDVGNHLDTTATARFDKLDGVTGSLLTNVQKADTTVGKVLSEVDQERKQAGKRHAALLKEIQKAVPHVRTFSEVNDNTLRAVRALVELKKHVLDPKVTSTNQDSVFDDALRKANQEIGSEGDFAERLSEAAGHFPGERSKCFWMLHELVEDVVRAASKTSEVTS